MLRFGYLGKWSPCAYESLSTKGEDYYPCTLLYDSDFTSTRSFKSKVKYVT
jgi:hypothetical protein